MPDLRPVQRFERDVLKVERAYQRDVSGYLTDTRRVILEAVLVSGIKNPQLAIMIRRELDNVRLGFGQAGREQSIDLGKAAARQVESQLLDLRKVRPTAPHINDLQGPTQNTRHSILAGLVDNLGGLLDELELRLIGELGRLRSSDTPTDQAVDRLLSTRVVDGRASVWRKAVNTITTESQVDLWTAATSIVSNYFNAGQQHDGRQWHKQAIAAIDERTTDCCLQVHGQIVGLDQPFKLTGTPRFADEQQNPPFHFFCRTGTSLWVEELEEFGVTTDDMREAARAELTAREDGSRVEIHPAHATSRR